MAQFTDEQVAAAIQQSLQDGFSAIDILQRATELGATPDQVSRAATVLSSIGYDVGGFGAPAAAPAPYYAPEPAAAPAPAAAPTTSSGALKAALQDPSFVTSDLSFTGDQGPRTLPASGQYGGSLVEQTKTPASFFDPNAAEDAPDVTTYKVTTPLGGNVYKTDTLTASGQLISSQTYKDQGLGALAPVVGMAATALLPGVGSAIAEALNVSQAVGTALAKAGLDVAQGKPIDKAIQDAAVSSLIQTGSSDLANQIVAAGTDPQAAKVITSAAASAAQTAARGGSAEDVLKAAAGAATGVITTDITGQAPIGLLGQQLVTTGDVGKATLGTAAATAGQIIGQAGKTPVAEKTAETYPTDRLKQVEQRAAELTAQAPSTFGGGQPVISQEAQDLISLIEKPPGEQTAFLGLMLGAGQTIANALQRLAATPAGQQVIQEAAQTSQAVRNALINTGFLTAAGVAAFIGGKSFEESRKSFDPARQDFLSTFGGRERTEPTAPLAAQIPTELPPTAAPGLVAEVPPTTVPGSVAPDQKVQVSGGVGKPIAPVQIPKLPGLEQLTDLITIPGITIPDIERLTGIDFSGSAPAAAPSSAPAAGGGEAPAEGEATAQPAGEAITAETDLSKQDPQKVLTNLLNRIGVGSFVPGAVAAASPLPKPDTVPPALAPTTPVKTAPSVVQPDVPTAPVPSPTVPEGPAVGPEAAPVTKLPKRKEDGVEQPVTEPQTVTVITTNPDTNQSLVVNPEGEVSIVQTPPGVQPNETVTLPAAKPTLPEVLPQVEPTVVPKTVPSVVPQVIPKVVPEVMPKVVPVAQPEVVKQPTAPVAPVTTEILDLVKQYPLEIPITPVKTVTPPPLPPTLPVPPVEPPTVQPPPPIEEEPAPKPPIVPEPPEPPEPPVLPEPPAPPVVLEPVVKPEVKEKETVVNKKDKTPIEEPSPITPITVKPVTPTTPSSVLSTLTGLYRSPLEQALSAYTPPGEIEDPSSGKTRRNVWNEASLRLKDALGL